MNYLITGSNGFVGKALTYSLIEEGHIVYGLDYESSVIKKTDNFYHFEADITKSKNLHLILKNLNIDGVFHLAAQSSVAKSWENPSLTYEINIIGTSTLIEALKTAYKNNLPRLLFFSSSEVYGNIKQIEIKETDCLEPVNPYGYSKFFAEKIIENFYPNYLIVRPFSILGQGQKDCFAVPNFCKQVALMIKKTIPLYLNVGNVKLMRDFVDIDDAVRAFKLIMQKSLPKEIYNLASNNSVLLEEVINILKRISAIDFTINVDEKRLRPVEVQNINASIQKIKCLGWTPTVPLEETLNKILKSFL